MKVGCDSSSIGIIGAGSWGTALSVHLGRAGRRCALWGRNPESISEIRKRRENARYLPGISIPENVLITHSIEEAIHESPVALIAVPSHVFRSVMERIASILDKDDKTIFVSCAKGIENDTLYFMTDIMREVLSRDTSENIAVLSGPSFAAEVAQGLPTAVTVAARDARLAAYLQDILSYGTFRVYTSQDCIGVEVGVAVKNVLAIAVGISDGIGLGSNARAALITRGLAEIVRLGLKMEASPLTFAGLSGLGDLVLTCTGDLSRNRQVGLRLGRGEDIASILDSMCMVAEGVRTSKALYELSIRLQCDMPISQAVYNVIYRDTSPGEALSQLLERPLRPEWG